MFRFTSCPQYPRSGGGGHFARGERKYMAQSTLSFPYLGIATLHCVIPHFGLTSAALTGPVGRGPCGETSVHLTYKARPKRSSSERAQLFENISERHAPRLFCRRCCHHLSGTCPGALVAAPVEVPPQMYFSLRVFSFVVSRDLILHGEPVTLLVTLESPTVQPQFRLFMRWFRTLQRPGGSLFQKVRREEP